MKIRNRLMRSYTGRVTKAYTQGGMETTLQILKIPVIDHIEHSEDEDFDEGEDLRLQCNGCKRTIDILCDMKGNIVGARCPTCNDKIVAS